MNKVLYLKLCPICGALMKRQLCFGATAVSDPVPRVSQIKKYYAYICPKCNYFSKGALK